jgi:hypothetical protein
MTRERPPERVWPGLCPAGAFFMSREYGEFDSGVDRVLPMSEEAASELWVALMVAGSMVLVGLAALVWGWLWVSR